VLPAPWRAEGWEHFERVLPCVQAPWHSLRRWRAAPYGAALAKLVRRQGAGRMLDRASWWHGLIEARKTRAPAPCWAAHAPDAELPGSYGDLAG